MPLTLVQHKFIQGASMTGYGFVMSCKSIPYEGETQQIILYFGKMIIFGQQDSENDIGDSELV